MTRILKAHGMAFAMLFAFAAFASAAPAATHHFDGSPGDAFEVVENSNQVFTFTTGGSIGFVCHEAMPGGEVEEETATTLTIDPAYDDCFDEWNGEELSSRPNLRSNGCHYTFQSTTLEGNPTGGEHAGLEIGCDDPETPGMTTTVTALELPCVLIPPQTIEHAVRYEELEEGSVEVDVTAHGIQSITETVCRGSEGANETSQVHANGSYSGSIVLTTRNGLSLTTTP